MFQCLLFNSLLTHFLIACLPSRYNNSLFIHVHFYFKAKAQLSLQNNSITNTSYHFFPFHSLCCNCATKILQPNMTDEDATSERCWHNIKRCWHNIKAWWRYLRSQLRVVLQTCSSKIRPGKVKLQLWSFFKQTIEPLVLRSLKTNILSNVQPALEKTTDRVYFQTLSVVQVSDFHAWYLEMPSIIILSWLKNTFQTTKDGY